MKVGDKVRVVNPDALNYGRVGRINCVFPDGYHVVFSTRWGDYGFYKRQDVEPAEVTVPASEETPRLDKQQIRDAIWRVEVQRALVGDCGPAANGDAFETWLLRLLAAQDQRERMEGGIYRG